MWKCCISAIRMMAVLTAFAVLGSVRADAQPTNGLPAPAWQLADANGNTVRLSDFAGKVVLLNFFGSWCAPSLWQVPDLIELQRDYGTNGLVVVGVGTQETAADLAAFATANQVNYTLIPSSNQILYDYGVLPAGRIPVTAVIDRDGILVNWFLSYHSKSVYEDAVRVALDASPRLKVQASGGSLTVSWPVSETAFVLETKTDYSPSGTWIQVPNTVITDNGTNRVTLRASQTTGFFRLRERS